MVQLSKQERRLAERAGNGSAEESPLSDSMVLAVGWVLERRRRPTVGLGEYLASHDADDLRGQVESAELRGKALDEALREAGLSTSGTADEKRARLADGVES